MSTRVSFSGENGDRPLRERVETVEERADYHDYVAGKVASIDAGLATLTARHDESSKALHGKIDRVEKRTRKRHAETAAIGVAGLAVSRVVEASADIEKHPFGVVVMGFVLVAMWWMFRRDHAERSAEK